MSAPMDVPRLAMDSNRICEVEATVVTGFEEIAKDEAVEKFNVTVNVRRGMISMHIPLESVPKVLELGCVDNCYVVMTTITEFEFTQDELECMRKLRNLVKSVDWERGLAAWRQVFSFNYPIASKPEVIPETLGEPILSSRVHHTGKIGKLPKEGKRNKGKWRKTKVKDQNETEESKDVGTEKISDSCDTEKNIKSGDQTSEEISQSGDQTKSLNQENKSEISDESEVTEMKGDNSTKLDNNEIPANKKQRVKITENDPTKPSFRVTCYRNGSNHPFDSMGAASNFGGAVNDYFNWNVSMKNFDIEVILNIENKEVRVCLALNRGSLHKRNITAFGPTTLRPTIAFNMLRLCKIQPGDVVCDPMCGSGSIPIQAAISWPESVHICGEIARKALVRTEENIEALNKKNLECKKAPIQLDAFKWDATDLPLKNESVDVFITDLPFGKRMGSKEDNWNLYPRCIMEMARVSKRGTGRACLLTQDKKCINKAMSMTAKYWKCRNMVGFNMGGLAACVYILHRKDTTFDFLDSYVGVKNLYTSDKKAKPITDTDDSIPE